MATEEAVVGEIAEPESSPDAGDGKRDRSTIEFPYLDLDAAIEVAQGVHQVGGRVAHGTNLRRTSIRRHRAEGSACG